LTGVASASTATFFKSEQKGNFYEKSVYLYLHGVARVLSYPRPAAHPNPKTDKKPVCALVFVLRALRHSFRDDFSCDCGRHSDTAGRSRRACSRNYPELAWSRTFSRRLRLLRRGFRDGMVHGLNFNGHQAMKDSQFVMTNEKIKILAGK